jgi:replicative DNA helicase
MKTDNPPPHSLEAEMALLGGLILADHPTIAEAQTILPGPNAFWVTRHGAIYAAILACAASMPFGATSEAAVGVAPLLVAVQPGWEGEGNPGEYIVKLVTETPGAATVPHFAKIVRDLHQRRMLAQAGEILAQAANDPNGRDNDALASMAADAIGRAVSGGRQDVVVSIGSACDGVLDDLSKGVPSVLSTGIPKFDREFGGFPAGCVTTVMGTPSSGKTTLCLQILLGFSKSGHGVMVFSNEQNCRRIAATLLTQSGAGPIHRLMSQGNATGEQIEAAHEASTRIRTLPVSMVEEPMHAAAIFAHAKLAKSKGVSVVMVDYLQDLPPIPGYITGEERVGEGMRNLKRIARELGMTCIIVSQVDKATSKTGQRPTMYDGMYSSRIEQASDMMIAVWREFLNVPMPVGCSEFEMENWREQNRRAELCLLKNKYGPKGNVVLRFDPARMMFDGE